jgi:hypothetical protein
MGPGRPRKNLSQYKDELLGLIQKGKTHHELIHFLSTTHDVQVSRPTLAQWIQDWAETKRDITEDTPQLRLAIADVYFSAQSIDDETMLRILRQESFTVSLRGLISIRKDLGIYRNSSPYAPKLSREELADIVNKEFAKGGVLDYGRVQLTSYFRQQRYIIPRDLLFKTAKSHPQYKERVEDRTRKLNRRRGEYSVPGPDFLWSIDGYMKLEQFGIEIYAAIDVRTRLVLWVYVGVSARTQISVLMQYIRTLKITARKPYKIRSDRGVETPMLGDAHFALSQKENPNVQFSEVFIYGTSVMNQRIEAWWEVLASSQLNVWIVSTRCCLY